MNFINLAMAAGALGVALPILAHLLSKKRYDVVDWGAMQFLELGQNARRKILLEQLLLLLLRIGLILLLVLAFMRPWIGASLGSYAAGLLIAVRLLLVGAFVVTLVKPIGGNRLGAVQLGTQTAIVVLFALTFVPDPERLVKKFSDQDRDIVVIVDGSYSMGWQGTSRSPHKAAVQDAQQLLNVLPGGSAVALIDARDHARVVIESPTRDFARVRQELNKLPPPSGTSNLAEATRKAAQILSRTSNLAREIIVLTDGQALGWRPDDKGLWAQYDDQLDLPSIRPRTWVLNVAEVKAGENYAVDKLQLSREVTAVGYPVRIKTKIRHFGKSPITRRVFLELDGQRLAGQTQTKKFQKPGGEESVEFEYKFPSAGSHRVSVVLEADNLPGDNRADAAVTVTEALPVLLVDGDPNLRDFIKSESVFAMSALTPEDAESPWVKAEMVTWNKLSGKLKDLHHYEAVFLANVPRLTGGQLAALTEYVRNGGGVFFALGNKIDRAWYNSKLYAGGRGLLPAEIGKLEENKDETKQTVQVLDKSLEVPWIQRFQLKNDGGFCLARFSHRWTTKLPPAGVELAPPTKEDDGEKADKKTPPLTFGEAVVAARLSTKDPLIVTRKVGRGSVVLMTSAIDGDWSTLPAKDDYTPLLHEIVFFLASNKASRNVDAGTPLLLRLPEETGLDGYAFFGPGETAFDFTPGGVINGKQIVRLDDTSLPGVYTFQRKTEDGKPDLRSTPEYFVVNFDRSESDLTPLTEAQQTVLANSETSELPRMTFKATEDDLVNEMLADNSRSELWKFFMLLFPLLFVFEVVMTRRMVQGGHAVDDGEGESAAEGPPPGKSGGPPPLPPGDPRRERRSVVRKGDVFDDVFDDYDYEEAPART